MKNKNELPETPAETTAPEMSAPEIILSDGNPETLPETPAPEMSAETAADLGCHGLPPEMMTTTNNPASDIYTPDEFRQKFVAVLEFLENPATASNLAGELISNGRNLTADKIYGLASRVSWLRWVIDRRAQLLADSLQIAAFMAVETNVIVYNWTGANLFERVKLWVQRKIKQRRQADDQAGERKQSRNLFGWVFSGRQAAEKATEPDKSPAA